MPVHVFNHRITPAEMKEAENKAERELAEGASRSARRHANGVRLSRAPVSNSFRHAIEAVQSHGKHGGRRTMRKRGKKGSRKSRK